MSLKERIITVQTSPLVLTGRRLQILITELYKSVDPYFLIITTTLYVIPLTHKL